MTESPRVDGGATVYRLHDIGYAVALDRAAGLLGDRMMGRAVPARTEARAIQIRNPPLFVTMGTRDVIVGGVPTPATLSAHVFDFGVCSLHLRLRAKPDVTWEDFAAFGKALSQSPDVGAALDATLAELIQRLQQAIERPTLAPVAEEYTVYRVDRLTAGDAAAGQPAVALIGDAALLSLLVGENRPVSGAARRELLPHRFSYYDDDLTVVTWENALVVEPRAEDRDVEYVLEFANAQLLELRIFDTQLDAELPEIYDQVAAARGRRHPRLASLFRTVMGDLQTRVADVTETVERVENSLKLTNDVYLARIYAATMELFRERDWRRSIERKVSILRDTYAMLSGEAQAARAEWLELAIIVLIVAELILGILRGHF